MKRFNITRISDGVITHSYMAEVAQEAQPEWGDPDSYTIAEVDATQELSDMDKENRRLKLVNQKIVLALRAICEAVIDNNKTKLQAIYTQLKGID